MDYLQAIRIATAPLPMFVLAAVGAFGRYVDPYAAMIGVHDDERRWFAMAFLIGSVALVGHFAAWIRNCFRWYQFRRAFGR